MSDTFTLIIPFVVQGAAMAFDEFWLHRKRNLPLWERVGHPLDTLTLIACLGWAATQPPGGTQRMIFATLAVISCLMITKDEWIHSRECQPIEQWVHALLFVLHPVVLGMAYLGWTQGYGRGVILAQLLTVSAFFVYQVVYWNFLKRPHEKTARSVTQQ